MTQSLCPLLDHMETLQSDSMLSATSSQMLIYSSRSELLSMQFLAIQLKLLLFNTNAPTLHILINFNSQN